MKHDLLKQIIRMGSSILAQVKVTSAMNPILWLCGLSALFFLPSAYVFKEVGWIPYALIIAILALFGIAGLAYVGFAICSPDRLQSEEFQIKNISYKLYEQGKIPEGIDADSLVGVPAPIINELSPKTEDNK